MNTKRGRLLITIAVALVLATAAWATCLPCIKEIINSGAKSSQESLHAVAQRMPELVESGRISIADAEAFYKRAVEIEDWYCDEIDKLLRATAAKTKPPWEAKKEKDGGGR